MAFLLFKPNVPNQEGMVVALAADQTAIDNGLWINNEETNKIEITTDQYNQIKQDLIAPLSYDDSNNIQWRDMSDVGEASVLTTEELNTQRASIVENYTTIKNNEPNYPNMSAIDSAISLMNGLDFTAVGGTDDKNVWYYAYQADNSYLHILEIM